MRLVVVVIGALLALCGTPARSEELRNWFNDPFFQLTAAIPGCQEPAGPRVSAAERQAQSHRRAEKGTTCWLAQEQDCEHPSAYAYDSSIARSIQSMPLVAAQGTSLWVTVQGRVVYVEGCVAQEAQASQVEAAIRKLPHVQQVIAIVTASSNAVLPYRVFNECFKIADPQERSRCLASNSTSYEQYKREAKAASEPK